MEQPYILCGLGRVGWRVLEYLRAAGVPVVVVDTRCSPQDPRLGNLRLVHGDCRNKEVLEIAGVARARGVLIMTNDDLVNISTGLLVRHLNKDVRIVMRLFNENLVPRLGKAFTNTFALSTANLTAPLFAMSALTGQALGTIRLDGAQDGLRPLAEIAVAPNSPFCGLSIEELANKFALQVVAHLPAIGKERFLLEVEPQARLSTGDRLIVCGELKVLTRWLENESDTLLDVRWAGLLRRMGRVAWQTLREVDLSVKVCTGVLIMVIFFSTIVLHLAQDEYPWHRALYRTISLMATAADMHADDPQARWMSVFASVLRLLGAAVVAAFTAILTNYLLRARLSGALEFRRIPDSGHVVVCGLGNIGFRVVEELVQRKERVVVIEQSRDSRFVTTARRLGVPVLMGDATVTAVLEQAHAGQARAVIASTSDDLLNLEVALLVREINPSQRVVLHMSDPHLAQMLRESANVRLALSIPILAAPAFVAALFGDRVQSVLMIQGRMLAAVDVLIPPQDTCLAGKTVRAVAIDYQLVPVAVFDGEGNLLEQRAKVRLQAGYRLVAISAISDLQRLLHREPARADYAVDVTGCAPGARSRLAASFWQQHGMSAEAAAHGLEQLPFCLGSAFTRGQAEDLVSLLQEEQVAARTRQLGAKS
jgi:Trk K+ transport system NAD-binding subunit